MLYFGPLCSLRTLHNIWDNKMTTNAFVLSWDQLGLESIIPITQYEDWEHQNLLDILANKKPEQNPLGAILFSLKMRAQFNQQRHYEIYAIDCSEDITEEWWRNSFDSAPQAMADMVRDRGVKIYSDRISNNIKIV